MMHLIATNACIVIRTLVKESAKEMLAHKHHANDIITPHQGATESHLGNTSGSDNVTGGDCKRIQIIGDTVEHISVYLFPFIIEYSIIGISVFSR